MSRTKSPYLALTSSYAIALSIVAVLFVGANIYLHNAIEDQRKVAAVVDMAGRERMLAQRVAWLANRYSTAGESSTRELLQSAITEMAITTDLLRTGRIDPDTVIPVPAGVARVYAEQNLNNRLRTFLTHARVVAFNNIAPDEAAVSQAVTDGMAQITAEADGPLLASLNAVGAEYVREADTRIARLQFNQRLTLAGILFTLAAEAFLIFRPLVGKVTDYVDEVLKHSRKASMARRAAQQASAAKSAFLSNMSHELRTPMTGIMGICDLLRSAPQSPEQAKMTAMLGQSAQILLDLLNDILDLAKIEAGHLTLESIDFDLSALLTDVRNLFDPGMAEKGLAFTMESAVDVGAVFRGDPKHIRQILYNLVGNALKFTESGAVQVHTRSEPDQDGSIVLAFAVTDSGIGISEEGLSRLFRKFEQEEASTSRRYGGTGLGLAICKQLSEAMGGGIDVKSTKGLGSTFTFRVRVQRGDPAAVTAAAIATPIQAGRELDGLRLRILLAEDNLTTQFIIARMLSLWGQTVVSAADGRSAVALAAQEKFDLILMDMQMPVMDGDEAARLIRANGGASSATPIVALTADGIREHHQRYLEAGCDIVLTKPVIWTALAREIRTWARPGAAPIAEPPAPVEHAAAVEPVRESAQVLNRHMLGGLQQALSPQDMEEVLQQFLGTMASYRSHLEEHIAAGDFHQARRTAHRLKGLCGQLGADEVAEIAAWIEEESTDIEGVVEKVPHLDDSIARARAAVLEMAPGMDGLS